MSFPSVFMVFNSNSGSATAQSGCWPFDMEASEPPAVVLSCCAYKDHLGLAYVDLEEPAACLRVAEVVDPEFKHLERRSAAFEDLLCSHMKHS